jgi:hypothetical protein
MLTYMGIEEKTVHAPRVGLVAAIHVFVFSPQVIQVVLMFHFRIVDPRAADSDWTNNKNSGKVHGRKKEQLTNHQEYRHSSCLEVSMDECTELLREMNKSHT